MDAGERAQEQQRDDGCTVLSCNFAPQESFEKLKGGTSSQLHHRVNELPGRCC